VRGSGGTCRAGARRGRTLLPECVAGPDPPSGAKRGWELEPLSGRAAVIRLSRAVIYRAVIHRAVIHRAVIHRAVIHRA
jgi:hypothetical protein